MLQSGCTCYYFRHRFCPRGLRWCLNHAHWLTIPHGQTHNAVAFLFLEFMIEDCEAPLFERDHVGQSSADRSEGSGGLLTNKRYDRLDGWVCWVDVLYA